MTEADNVAVVQRAYDAFQRGDLPAVLDTLTDDIDWHVPGSHAIPYAGRWRGKAEVTQFFTRLAQTTELTPFEPREYLPVGGTVVVLGHYAGRVKATGRGIRAEWTMVFRLREGRIARFQEYTDTENLANSFSTK